MASNTKTEVVQLTRQQLDILPEYSMTHPTGTYIGKQWKRNLNVYGHSLNGPGPDWWMGEYIEIASETEVGIKWRKVEIVVPRRVQLRNLLPQGVSIGTVGLRTMAAPSISMTPV